MDETRYEFEFPDEGATLTLVRVDKTSPQFQAAIDAYLRPIELASRLKKISDERQLDALARAYVAMGVVVSITGSGGDDPVRWLVEHPEAFQVVRAWFEDETGEVEEALRSGGQSPHDQHVSPTDR